MPPPAKPTENVTAVAAAAKRTTTGFLRDRIARRKELEEAALDGAAKEDEADNDTFSSQQKTELANLTNDDPSDLNLFRESYVLTMTQSAHSFDASASSSAVDSFADLFDTIESKVAFESFAEVGFFFCII